MRQRTIPRVTVAIRSDNVIQLLSGHTVATALPPAFLKDLRRWLTMAFTSWPPHLSRYEVTMAQKAVDCWIDRAVKEDVLTLTDIGWRYVPPRE